jgi:hypothetical protein
VVGTAHETELADAGSACSACHIPHQAAGEKKYWAQERVLAGKGGTTSVGRAEAFLPSSGTGRGNTVLPRPPAISGHTQRRRGGTREHRRHRS